MDRYNLLYIKSLEFLYGLCDFFFSRPYQMESSNNTINIRDTGYIYGLLNGINDACVTTTCYNNEALRGSNKNALIIKNFIALYLTILFYTEYIQRLPDMFSCNLPSCPYPFC